MDCRVGGWICGLVVVGCQIDGVLVDGCLGLPIVGWLLRWLVVGGVVDCVGGNLRSYLLVELSAWRVDSKRSLRERRKTRFEGSSSNEGERDRER